MNLLGLRCLTEWGWGVRVREKGCGTDVMGLFWMWSIGIYSLVERSDPTTRYTAPIDRDWTRFRSLVDRTARDVRDTWQGQ